MAATGTYDRSHVLVMPKKFIILRGFQLALGCILFGFGIFGIIAAPFSGILLTFVTVSAVVSPLLSHNLLLQLLGRAVEVKR